MRAAGYAVAAVSYDTVDKLADFAARRNIGFTLLADPRSEIIDAFGVRNKAYAPGSSGYGMARPIIFVIDANGVITHRFSKEDYRYRPKVEDVLAAIGG